MMTLLIAYSLIASGAFAIFMVYANELHKQ